MDKANHYGSSMNLPIEASKADYQDRVAAFAYTGVLASKADDQDNHYMRLPISDRQTRLTNITSTLHKLR